MFSTGPSLLKPASQDITRYYKHQIHQNLEPSSWLFAIALWSSASSLSNSSEILVRNLELKEPAPRRPHGFWWVFVSYFWEIATHLSLTKYRNLGKTTENWKLKENVGIAAWSEQFVLRRRQVKSTASIITAGHSTDTAVPILKPMLPRLQTAGPLSENRPFKPSSTQSGSIFHSPIIANKRFENQAHVSFDLIRW